MTSEVRLLALSKNNLSNVAAIHMRAFQGSALTALGLAAVQRYYAWQLCGPHDAVAIGVSLGDALVGFCFGGVFRGALSGFVRANRSFLIRRVLTHPWLVANPIFRDRLVLGVRALRISRRKPSATNIPQQAQVQRSFGILAIAVDPAFQGTGVGKILIQDIESQAARRDFVRMHLTVQIDNRQAIRFYERLGWEKIANNSAWDGSMSKLLTSPLSMPES